MSPRYIDQEALQAREEEILDSALKIISEHGIVALTMDKLVASVSYSKGTIYNHFSSKEDVFAALSNRNMTRVADLFSRAAAIESSARNCMTAIGFSYMLSVLISPQHFALVMNAKTEMFEKASDTRRDQHAEVDDKLFKIICNIIQKAIDNKELVMQKGVDIQQVSFSLWAMSFGTIGLLLNGEKVCSGTTGMMLENRVIEHGNIVMDGLGWKRASHDENHDRDFINYLKSDVFAKEMSVIEAQGLYLSDREQ